MNSIQYSSNCKSLSKQYFRVGSRSSKIWALRYQTKSPWGGLDRGGCITGGTLLTLSKVRTYSLPTAALTTVCTKFLIAKELIYWDLGLPKFSVLIAIPYVHVGSSHVRDYSARQYLVWTTCHSVVTFLFFIFSHSLEVFMGCAKGGKGREGKKKSRSANFRGYLVNRRISTARHSHAYHSTHDENWVRQLL